MFDGIVEQLEDEGDKPRLSYFLTERFLPTQRNLKAYDFSQSVVGSLVRFVESTEPSLRVEDVRAHHVERLRAYYGREQRAPRTLNVYQQELYQALNHAVDLGILDANPLVRVKPLTVDNRRTRFLSMHDFVRVLSAAENVDAHDVFLVIGLTGLRPSNVRLLTVDEVDGRLLRIPPAKMKNQRHGIIPLSRYVADLLATRIATLGDDASALLFPAKGTDNNPKSRDNLSRSYRAVARRLPGLEWSSLYDLRHFFASELANKQGANEQQIGRLLCHVGQTVTSRYVHQDIEDLRHFVDELARRYLDAAGSPSLSRQEERPDEDHITV